MDWYFWTFTCSRFSLYLVILLPSLSSLPSTILVDEPEAKIWWSSAYVEISPLSYACISNIILKWAPRKETKQRPLRTTPLIVFFHWLVTEPSLTLFCLSEKYERRRLRADPEKLYYSSLFISSGALLMSEDNTPKTCLLSRSFFHFSTSLSNVVSHPLFFR